MATSPQPRATRTVVLLRPSERKRLQKLADAEQVSAGEILRRSLDSYEQELPASEKEVLTTLFADMNTALDGALDSIRSARVEIRETLDKIAQMKAAHS